MSDMVRVRVVLIIEVDADAHNETYGRGTDRKTITEDIRSSVLNMVQGSPLVDECIGTVTPGR